MASCCCTSKENSAQWFSTVARDVLRACSDNSKTCSAKIGVTSHAPRLLMDSLIDGTLPSACASKLEWLTQHTAADYNSFMAASQFAHVLMGPFWHRVGRCSPSDVKELNFFHAKRRAASAATAALMVPPKYNLGLATLIGVNEVRADTRGRACSIVCV